MAHLDTTADVSGGRLRVVVDAPDDRPDATPLLLIHSAVVDLRSWDAMVPILVDAGYRVVRYDMRGYGSSTTEDIGFSNRDDLRAVLDSLGIRRTAVVGNSRGAMVALDTILESPERFVAYAWVGGGISGFQGGDNTTEELALFDEADAAEGRGDVEALLDIEVRVWLDGIGQPPTRVPSGIREAMREMDRPLLATGHVFGKPRPLEPPANERLGELDLPVLVVIGELDVSGTKAAAARLASAAPRARLVSWPDVAHLVGMEQPERLALELIDFLGPLPRWS